jgi:hypothetical protein
VDTLDPRDDMPRQERRAGAFDTTPLGYGAEQRASFDPWNYRPDVGSITEHDLIGYHVETLDGRLGKVDEHSHAMGGSYLIVDTGPWIFGKKVMLPAGVVTQVDHDDHKVYVDRSKDQVKASPEFDPDQYTEMVYRDKLGSYYADTYSS